MLKKYILSSVPRTIESYKMIHHGDSVLACVSGGADSIGMLHFLIGISDKYDLKIGIAHLNHMLRGEESFRDERFVINIAKENNLPIFTAREDISAYKKKYKMSIEEAGRKARYDFFDKIAKKNGFDKIATAHHKDDNAELLLMRIIRGCGISGLCGIPPVRENKYIRPFIETEKSAIIDYVHANNLSYMEDKTNSDTEFTRNRIRCELIPLLKSSYNPEIINSLANLASIASEEEKWSKEKIESLLDEITIETKKEKIVLNIEKFRAITTGGKRRVLRSAIAHIKKNLKKISIIHIDSIIDLADSKADYASVNLPDNIYVSKETGKLIVSDKIDNDIDHYEYKLNQPCAIKIKEANRIIKFSIADLPEHFEKNEKKGFRTAWFDAEKINFPLTIRSYQNGDRFTPMGLFGSQKLKKFFNTAKVDIKKRRLCPVVLSKGKIIWIAGFRIDDSVKITEQTEKVIRGKIFTPNSPSKKKKTSLRF